MRNLTMNYIADTFFLPKTLKSIYYALFTFIPYGTRSIKKNKPRQNKYFVVSLFMQKYLQLYIALSTNRITCN